MQPHSQAQTQAKAQSESQPHSPLRLRRLPQVKEHCWHRGLQLPFQLQTRQNCWHRALRRVRAAANLKATMLPSQGQSQPEAT